VICICRADERNTAVISPYMRFGELSPRYVYHAACEWHGAQHMRTFLRRLMWRDLAYWCLWRFPHMADRPLRAYFEHEQWQPTARGEGKRSDCEKGRARFQAWCQGLTGYPLVDAAMKQLW
jgi:deoxyribodipyrimidine photo-lyase